MNYIITDRSVTVVINNRPKSIDNSHMNFAKVIDAIKERKTEEEINKLIDITHAINDFGKDSNVEVRNSEVYYKGEVVHSSLSTRILALIKEGFDISPFVNFMNNLYLNPSKSSVDELYGFLEACSLPITPDGHFLTYKKVRKDYTDVHSGTFDNSVGAKPSMPRYKVDEDSNRTCSTGLHVCSFSYLKHFGGDRIMICKVNPKDVVSIPTDYNKAKMRVSDYEVIGEIDKEEELPKYCTPKPKPGPIKEEFNTIKKYLAEVLSNYSFYDICDIVSEMDSTTESNRYMASITNSTSFWRNNLYTIMQEEVNLDELKEYLDL